MRLVPMSLWCCTLLLAGAGQARAAWDNVFQVTCFGCNKKPAATAYYYAPAPCPQPCQQPCQPACQQYQLRSYYTPVTTYRTSCYYEPVTTYRTSYYYEPVTSYRYSYYYDPCSCSYTAKACPTTCYQLKAQTCPVTSYLQRTQVVPETSYKQSYYYEPINPCGTAASMSPPAQMGSPAPMTAPTYPSSPGTAPTYPSSPGTAPTYPSSPGTAPTYPSSPGVNEGQGRGQLPGVSEQSRKIGFTDPQPRFTPSVPYRQPELQSPVPVQQKTPLQSQPPPSVRLDRIVLIDEPKAETQAQVAVEGKHSQPGATIVFVSADQLGDKQTVKADDQGEFKVNLSTGGWLVYVHDEKGNPVFKEKVQVKDNQPNRMVLTSR